jgi:transposase, IS30 family
VLGRSPNSISREIKQNSVKGIYDSGKAHHKATLRSKKSAGFKWKKIVQSKDLKKYVHKKLYENRSPEEVAGRLKYVEKHLPYVSKNSIRNYIKCVHGRRIEAHRGKIRVKKKRRGTKVSELKDRTFIGKRPKIINDRGRVGDLEADFIVSGKDGKGILLTVTDRKIRISFIGKIYPVTIENVHKAFLRIKKKFPELKSISTDNDILLKHHKELEKLLGVKIYFCDPYSSWQKGSIENTNKHIRKYIPKGADISFYSKSFIKKVEDKLNDRYLKVLNYYTPDEKLAQHRKRKNAVALDGFGMN